MSSRPASILNLKSMVSVPTFFFSCVSQTGLDEEVSWKWYLRLGHHLIIACYLSPACSSGRVMSAIFMVCPPWCNSRPSRTVSNVPQDIWDGMGSQSVLPMASSTIESVWPSASMAETCQQYLDLSRTHKSWMSSKCKYIHSNTGFHVGVIEWGLSLWHELWLETRENLSRATSMIAYIANFLEIAFVMQASMSAQFVSPM